MEHVFYFLADFFMCVVMPFLLFAALVRLVQALRRR